MVAGGGGGAAGGAGQVVSIPQRYCNDELSNLPCWTAPYMQNRALIPGYGPPPTAFPFPLYIFVYMLYLKYICVLIFMYVYVCCITIYLYICYISNIFVFLIYVCICMLYHDMPEHARLPLFHRRGRQRGRMHSIRPEPGFNSAPADVRTLPVDSSSARDPAPTPGTRGPRALVRVVGGRAFKGVSMTRHRAYICALCATCVPWCGWRRRARDAARGPAPRGAETPGREGLRTAPKGLRRVAILAGRGRAAGHVLAGMPSSMWCMVNGAPTAGCAVFK